MLQLPLTKENDSSERNASPRENTQPESPPKIRKFKALAFGLTASSSPALSSSTEVPDKENQTNDSEVILRRTQSFENDEK
jgi:hypothetical protein